MPERRLDEDDEHWVLANRGRVGGRRPIRIPKERSPSYHPPPRVRSRTNQELWDQSREDIRQVYIRRGLIPPGENQEPEPELEDEAPDSWRDDWREIRVQTPREREPRLWDHVTDRRSTHGT